VIISAAESSTHGHGERRAGQEGDQRRDHRAQVRFRPALLGNQEGDRRDRERRGHRHDHLDARPATTDALEHCDQRLEQRRRLVEPEHTAELAGRLQRRRAPRLQCHSR
jgi:hypothetical protein